ncbi:MAG: hypothetical protein ACWA5L_09325 [bacterium]
MQVMRTNISLSKVIGAVIAFLAVWWSSAYAADRPRVESGQTQVVADVNGREVTIAELRLEMARLNLDPLAKDAEAKALQSLTDRILIAESAKKAGLHKRPETLWRMEAAKELALAEIYMGTVSQPPEPTQDQVEKFILDNPTLFLKARLYTFSVLELANENFDLDRMTPLFDETTDFTALRSYLDENNIPYTLLPAYRSSSTFPKKIRDQLMQYNVDDNIVLRGDVQTSIMKINKISNDSISMEDALPIARAMLRQEESQKRVEKALKSLRANGKVTIYRQQAMPENME